MLGRVLAFVLSLVLPGIARADWYEASTGHFVVYSEQAPDRLRLFAANLERFDKAVRLRLNQRDEPIGPANRVTVYVVDNQRAVGALIGDSAVAGFYVSRAGGSIAFVPRTSGSGEAYDLNAQTVLLHEYSHHLMGSFWPHTVYPAWYVEGFAEFLGTALFEKDGAIIFGTPPLYRASGLMTGNVLPVDKLLTAETLRLDRAERDALYGRGWLLLHYLIYTPARSTQLASYMGALNAGKSSLEAASAFGDLKQLDRELEKYKYSKFPRLRVHAKALPIGEVTIRTLSAGEAAIMPARIRSDRGVGPRTAPGVYEMARKAAAPYPDDPGVQTALAEAAYDARDLAAAEAAADRALAADPRRVGALIYKARAQMAKAAAADDRSPATWDAIRKTIVSANRLDTRHPTPKILYYQSFLAQKQPPNSNAKDALYDAFQLAPQDDGLRLNTAAMFLKDGDAARAREYLMPLAYQPHASGLAQFAAKVIAAIDAGDKAGAGKLLEGEENKPGEDEAEMAPTRLP